MVSGFSVSKFLVCIGTTKVRINLLGMEIILGQMFHPLNALEALRGLA